MISWRKRVFPCMAAMAQGISSVCISAIPHMDVRKIQKFQVFIFTCSASVLAYLCPADGAMVLPDSLWFTTWELENPHRNGGILHGFAGKIIYQWWSFQCHVSEYWRVLAACWSLWSLSGSSKWSVEDLPAIPRWMLVVLSGITPNRVDIWEGRATEQRFWPEIPFTSSSAVLRLFVLGNPKWKAKHHGFSPLLGPLVLKAAQFFFFFRK